MRRFGVLAMPVLVLPVLAVLILAGGSAAGQPRPSLVLRGNPPVVVDGAHFHRGERVKLTVLPGPSIRVRANSRGGFSVRLGRVPVDRCSSLIVRARGSAGSLAVARRAPLPQCLPARGAGSAS